MEDIHKLLLDLAINLDMEVNLSTAVNPGAYKSIVCGGGGSFCEQKNIYNFF